MPQTTFCNILGSKISLLNRDEVVTLLQERGLRHGAGYVCISNVHTVVEGWSDAHFRNVTNQALLATADGMPLVWVSRFLRPRIHGRASGPDIMMGVLQADQQRALKHVLFGSTPEVLASLQKEIERHWPGTKIVGAISPPFGEVSAVERKNHIKTIVASQCHLVWVGLGAPKQELWMAEHTALIPSAILVGVGAAFDFLSLNKSRAPLWMQRVGLEWLHRLVSEPRRLFWRYARTNITFLFAALFQFLFQRRNV